jgi:hypothetical protein
MRTRQLISIALGVIGLLALRSFFASAADAPIYWHSANTGLTNPDVEALVAAPVSPTVLYAGAWGSGVFRSVDNGASWVTATGGLTLPFYINGALALAVSPVASNTLGLDRITLYAGDYYYRGLYRSRDGGQSWTWVLPDVGTRAIAVDPITPTIVYVGDREAGLYRSIDGGDTWDAANTGLSDTRINALATGDNHLYAGAYTYVFTSTTHGAGWTLAHTFSSTVQALAVHPFTPTLIYASTRSDGLYRSADGGASWTPLTTGLPANVWVTSLSIAPSIMYVGAWEGQVYRSADLGDSWEGLGYLGNVYAVLAHPDAASVVYAGTSNNSLFRGSVLDHITLDPISTTQYVYRPFTLTVTARDALGFPLSSASAQIRELVQHDARLANTLAAGYNGSAMLTDTAGLITPTSVSLIGGVAVQLVAFKQTLAGDTITAALKIERLQTASHLFKVQWFAQIALPFVIK